VPVGAAPPAGTEVAVAIKVTDCPNTLGLAEEVTDVKLCCAAEAELVPNATINPAASSMIGTAAIAVRLNPPKRDRRPRRPAIDKLLLMTRAARHPLPTRECAAAPRSATEPPPEQLRAFPQPIRRQFANSINNGWSICKNLIYIDGYYLSVFDRILGVRPLVEFASLLFIAEANDLIVIKLTDWVGVQAVPRSQRLILSLAHRRSLVRAAVARTRRRGARLVEPAGKPL
jgi:hypothetical protein